MYTKWKGTLEYVTVYAPIPMAVPMTTNKGVRVLNLMLTAARRGNCRSLESSRVEDGVLCNDKIQRYLCHSAPLAPFHMASFIESKFRFFLITMDCSLLSFRTPNSSLEGATELKFAPFRSS